MGFKPCSELKVFHDSNLKEKIWLTFSSSAVPFRIQEKKEIVLNTTQKRL